MDDPVRLFGRLNLQHRGDRRVESVRIRIQSANPVGALVRVADVQLQPGRYVTGWTLNARDLGVQPIDGWSWRNAVVAGGRTLVIAADAASASPTVWDVRGSVPAARVGSFLFGSIPDAARVDGAAHSATQGAGIPPHLTARADIDVPVSINGRALVCCWFRGLTVPTDTLLVPPLPPHVDGPLTDAHPGWGMVLANHATWADAVTAHPTWKV